MDQGQNSEQNPSAFQNSQEMEEVIQLLKEVGQFNQNELAQFREAIHDSKLDRVLGSIFGSMIGDALGSYCEFLKRIDPSQASRIMSMPGGGTFVTILPGQYTDDNEMAYHLLQGLCTFNEEADFSQQKARILKQIGTQFVRWVDNYPFDIGNTCGAAIYILREHLNYLKSEAQTKQMEQIYRKINLENQSRESNGSLMRITPMAAFISLLQLNPIQQKDFIIGQIKLTHPNKHLRIAGLSWVYLLSEVINRKTNEPKEFAHIIKKLQEVEYFNPILSWFNEARKKRSESMTAAHNMGWAKIAWSYGLKFLHYLSTQRLSFNDENLYKTWIQWVILRAGDTDTNAAISGGLIGAVIGFRRLPIQYLRKVFAVKYDPTVMTYTNRPREYEPSNFLRRVLLLIKKCKNHRKGREDKQMKQEMG